MATPALTSLKELFIHELRDMYNAERQLAEALPRMAQAATRSKLEKAFNTHLEETRSHVERLEDIFDSLGVNPEGVKCEAMEGLLKEGEERIDQQGHDAVKDAALISAAQRIEHYEIAGYGTVRTYAEELGLENAANVIDAILGEEKNADQTLNRIALGGWLSEGINIEAQEQTEA